MPGTVARGAHADQGDGLVGDDAERAVGWDGIEAPEAEVLLGAGDEKGTGLIEFVQTAKVHVGTGHDIGCARFRDQQFECVDVMELSVGDVDEAWDGAEYFEQGVRLDRGLGLAEGCPREHRQPQIDGGRAKGMGGFVEFAGRGLVGAQAACLGDQPLAEIGIDAPIAPFVGVGEGRTADRCAEAGVVELGGPCGETASRSRRLSRPVSWANAMAPSPPQRATIRASVADGRKPTT